MSEHIFVSNVLIKKSRNGNWFVNKIYTSVGDFVLGEETNNQDLAIKSESIIEEIRKHILPQIKEFTKSENSLPQKNTIR